MQPLVSIVVPVYNEQRYLQRFINSVLVQSYTRIEAIFVDDGSSDSTLSILRKARTKHKHIRFFPRPHTGAPGVARNFGARKAKGKIIVFVDADMVLDKNYVRDITKLIREGKEIGTSHDTELVNNPENLWARSLCINRIIGSPKTTGVYRAVLRDRFLKIGGFPVGKGYFDDDLSALGPARVTHAVCYHNNPETLKELYKHSKWVGRSLAQTSSLYRKVPVITIAGILAVAALVAFSQWHLLLAGVAIFFVLLGAFLLWKTIPRMIEEKRAEYLFSIPIIWLVRMAGYIVGTFQFVTR